MCGRSIPKWFKAILLSPEAANVSTYSSADAVGTQNSNDSDRQLKDRVDRLERELEIERRARALAGEMVGGHAVQGGQKGEGKRPRCIARPRTDCVRVRIRQWSRPAR